MKNNGQQNNGNSSEAATADSPVAFPNDSETQLQDISTLLQGAPVIQQTADSTTDKPADGIASAADFEQAAEKKPFSRRLGPKATTGAIISGLIMLPLSFVFLSGGSKQAENVAGVEEATENSTFVSSEDYAAMQAELEQLRGQQAFIDQQVDADAIDAMGRQKAAAAAATATSPTAKPATTATAAKPKPAPAKPRATTTASSRKSPAPRSSRVVTPAPRPTPVATAPRSSTPVAQAPVRQITAQPPEPVDPFERRAQLQALGTYGTPPPTAQASRPVSSRTSNPFDTASAYVQAIAVESPQAQPAFLQAQAVAPVETPLTEDELQYQQDADAVLALEPAELNSEAKSTSPEPETRDTQRENSRGDSAVIDPRRFRKSDKSQAISSTATSDPAEIASPMAIIPGTNVQAELPYGFSWQEGTPLPEVLMTTTEDIMAGSLTVIPAGTQLLGQAQIDPSSGTVTIQVVGLFGETRDVQIPRTSVVVRAVDGSVLTASASGGDLSRSSSGSDVGGFLMESLANSVGNVIDSDDSLVGDLAGGVAETVIDGQVRRSQANANARNARLASQPVVWTLKPRTVRLTFNNYIPLSSVAR